MAFRRPSGVRIRIAFQARYKCLSFLGSPFDRTPETNLEWIRVPLPCGVRVTLGCHFEQSLRATNTTGPLSLFAFLAVTQFQLSRLPILDGLEQVGTGSGRSGILKVMKCSGKEEKNDAMND